MPTSTVGPGKDYADLATWEAALGTGSQVAECYSGADLGFIQYDDTDPDDITITVAAGHVHDITNGATTGFAHCTNGAQFRRGNVVYEKLINTGGSITNFTNSDNILIQYCNFRFPDPQSTCIGLASSLGVTANVTFQGNVLYGGNGGFPGSRVLLFLSTGFGLASAGVLNANVFNNVFGGLLTNNFSECLSISSNDAGSILNAEIKNNVFLNANTANVISGTTGGAVINLDCSNNADNDGTVASVLGGSDNLINQTMSDWFEDEESDYLLKEASPGLCAGVAVDGYTQDVLGNEVQPNIGCHELVGNCASGGGYNPGAIFNLFHYEQIRRLRNR